MAPAPKPSGMEQSTSQTMLVEREKPNRAMAVRAVLTAATREVPKRLMSRALSRLDRTVKAATVTVTQLAPDTPTPNSG